MGIKQYLRPPATHETLGEYLQAINQARTILAAAARDRHPYAKPKTQASSSKDEASNNETKKGNRESGGWRRERSRNRSRDGYRDNRRSSHQDSRRDSYRNDRRDGSRDRRRDDDRGTKDSKRRDDDKGKDSKKKTDGVHWANNKTASDGDQSAPPSDDDIYSELSYAVTIIDRHLTYYKCHETFDSPTRTRSHTKKCGKVPPESMRTLSPLDPANRTCGYCRQLFPSRNLMFKHIKNCDNAKKGKIKAADAPEYEADPLPAPECAESPEEHREDNKNYNATELESTNDEQEPAPNNSIPPLIRESSPEEVTDGDDNPLSSYQHLRMKVRATPDGKSVDVCGDPGTSRSIIDRRLLATFEHTIEKREGRIGGVGKGVVETAD